MRSETISFWVGGIFTATPMYFLGAPFWAIWPSSLVVASLFCLIDISRSLLRVTKRSD